ncbi:MAG: hypothetical protein ACPL28_05640 [bacterium]
MNEVKKGITSSKMLTSAIILLILLNMPHVEKEMITESAREKSKSVALNWSMGATLFPVMIGISGFSFMPWRVNVGIVLSGIAIGPSMGHFYAEQPLRGLATIGLRTALGCLGRYSLDGFTWSIEYGGGSSFWFFLGTCGSAAGIIVSVIYDWATVSTSVKKYNEGIKTKFNLNFVPNIDIKEKKYGLSVACNF